MQLIFVPEPHFFILFFQFENDRNKRYLVVNI